MKEEYKIIYEFNLTSREKDILSLIVRGLSDKQISAERYISLNTLRTHIKSIFNKLDVKNRKDAIIKILSEEHEKYH